MEYFKVEGSNALCGEAKIHGAKNSILPLLAASYLCKGKSVFTNCPRLNDTFLAVSILRSLGAKVTFEKDIITVDAQNAGGNIIPEKTMNKMRSSIVFMSSIAAKTGRAKVSYPGGCQIGSRPIDLHLKAFGLLGADVIEDGADIICEAKNGFCGNEISLSFPSVGATENILIASSVAKGKTILYNAALEPEICDLARYLNKCGAKISGYGSSVIEIEGVKTLYGCEHNVISDRIEASTLLFAACMNKGDIKISGIDKSLFYPVILAGKEMGCDIKEESGAVRIKAPKKLSRIKLVRTMPYPGFPTDAQALVMAASCIANGTSTFIENIFESRYKHAYELMKMGADIKIEGRMAVVEGVKTLYGANVNATDLRGGAALLLAAMSAKGTSEIHGIHHIDRGYEKIEEVFSALGVKIQRVLKG